MTRSFEFLTIHERPAKPRTTGRTCLADIGVPNPVVAGTLELWHESMDTVKISAFTMTADDGALREKIRLYNEYGVDTQAGGPVLELARLQGKLDQTLERIADMGFRSLEVSAEALPMEYTAEEEAAVVSKAKALGLETHGEVGKKFPANDPLRNADGSLNVEATCRAVQLYLDAGCDFVYLEGHLLRQIIGDQAERADEFGGALIEAVEKIGLDKIVFEVPFTYLPYAAKRILQHWLVTAFGPDVNIGNVLIGEIAELDVIRCGMFPVFGARNGDHPYILASADSPTGIATGEWWRG